jgi:hypothetical protein
MKFSKHGLLAAVAVTALVAGGALAQQSPSAPSGSGVQGGSQMEKQEQKAPGMQGQGQTAPKGQVQGQGQSQSPRGQVQGQERSPGGAQTQDRMQSQQPGSKTDKSAQEPRQKTEGTAQDSKPGAKDSKQSVQLNNEQRTKISQTVREKNVNLRTVNRSDINFSINVGTVVPRTVTLYPLPAPIIAIVPAYRGYLYIVVDGDLLIIHPTTHEIVAVIPA